MKILKITKIASGIFLLALAISTLVPLRAAIATKIKDFEGTEPPQFIYFPAAKPAFVTTSTNGFTSNNGYVSMTDSTTSPAEPTGVTRMSLRFRATGTDAAAPWWDNDRNTTSTDRQRSEVKGISNLHQLPGETYEYSTTWRCSPGLLVSGGFFHFFQIKGIDGDNANPLVVMSIIKSGTAAVRTNTGTQSGFTIIRQFPYTPNTWQTVTIRVTPTPSDGSAATTGSVLVSVNGDAFIGASGISLYRASTTTFRPKWGMYRGITNASDNLNDGYIQHLYPSLNKYVAGATPVPSITSFAPTTAPAGTTLTVNGLNLSGSTVISIGGVAATITANTGTTLTTSVPATGASGYVVLRTINGTAVAPQQFTLGALAPALPTVTAVSPTTAKAGDTITINGTNLTGATAVTIGGVSASIVSNNGATLTVTVPANAATGAIVVTTPGGSATSTQTVTINTTPPVDPVLTVDKIMLSLAQNANATDTFNITSNIAWSTRIDPTTATWLTCAPNGGTGNSSGPLTATASANTTGVPRTASIVVTGGEITRTLIATQSATNTPGLAPTPPLPVGATFALAATDPGTPINRTCTVTSGSTLTSTDATGALSYEYAPAGNAATLLITDLNSVYSLQFTSATAGSLILYTFDAAGPRNLPGTFTYAAPAATYAVTVSKGSSDSTSYAAGATVTITANAAPSGQVFDKWTSNDVTLANPTLSKTTFTMPAKAVTVTANYKTQSAGGNTSGGNSGGGGGGGGGALSLWFLGALAAFIVARLRKRAS